MGRELRFVALVAVAFALAGAQQPQKQQQSSAGAKAAEHAVPTPPELPYKAYPNRNADACYGSKDHDAADLCAQWRAALATEKAAHEARRATTWAITATVLSLATVVGLIVTIWQTFGALGEARRGNLIAQRANARATRQALASADDTKKALRISGRNAAAASLLAKHSQRAARIQLRPYLTVSGIEVEEPVTRWKKRVCRVNIGLMNNGQTPATVTRFFIHFNWQANGMYTALLEAEKATRFRVHKGKQPTNIPLYINATGEGLGEPGQLLAFVALDYTDVFEKEHGEAFAFQMGEAGKSMFERLDFPRYMNHFPLPDYMEMLGVDENFEPIKKAEDREADHGQESQ